MNPKIPDQKVRDLALRLLAHEANAANSLGETTPPVARVSEKIRRRLSALAGSISFRVLLARALTLAKAQIPSLEPVQIKLDGSLDGLGQVHFDWSDDGGVMLIAQLIGLLIAFIGETLTLHLLVDSWPDLPGFSTELEKESRYDPTR
jgi:hypothetical protein